MRLRKERPICKTCGKRCKNLRSVYCSFTCQWDFSYKQYIEKWLRGEVDGNCGGEQISRHVRKYFLEKYHSKCSKCGWAKVHPVTHRIPLTLNHIDGNWKNSTFENLELLCPNCHSLTPNYGALNRGYGRKQRLKKIQESVLGA